MAYTAYSPVIQTDYIATQFLNSEQWAGAMASGMFNLDIIPAGFKGDYLNVPKVKPVAFSRLDDTSNTAVTPTRIATNDDKYPVLRNKATFQIRHTDIGRIGEPLLQKQMLQQGDEWARRAFYLTLGAAKAGLTAVGGLVIDQSSSLLTLDMIRKLRFNLIGDQSYRLNTLIITSNAMSALRKDILATYAANPAMAGSGANGLLREIFGIENVIITDVCPVTASGTTTDDDTVTGEEVTTTFLCSKDSFNLQYQIDPTVFESKDATIEGGAYNYQVISAFIAGLKGTKWTGSENPTDANLFSSANYSSAVTRAKEIGCVAITNKGLDPSA